MADTTFVDYVTPVPAAWLNDVNDLVYGTTTGTGALVLGTSPTLVTPVLGTPTSGVATNLTGTAAGLTAGNVTTNANLTGHITSVGNAAVLGSFTVAQLNTAISDADVATGGGTATGTNTGDQTATTVANTPAGSIAATTVQAAINELDTEKAALAGATFTGALNEKGFTVAAHATTCDIWTGGNVGTLTGGVVTFTDVADAPIADAWRWIRSNAAHILTNGANIAVQGNANLTLADGDMMLWHAITTTTFEVWVFKEDGTAVVATGAATGTLIAFTAITATNATWTPNASTTKMVVQGAGGGGAGGGANSGGTFSGVGGTSGAVFITATTSVSGTYNATIGAGGTGVSTAEGNDGGTTSFTGTGISGASAGGGQGGAYGPATGVGVGPASESMCLRIGESLFGLGGTVGNDTDGGAAAANTGAGGGGAYAGTVARAGGAGGSGVIFVWEYS